MKNFKGFSLIEMMIVLLVFTIIATFVVPIITQKTKIEKVPQEDSLLLEKIKILDKINIPIKT